LDIWPPNPYDDKLGPLIGSTKSTDISFDAEPPVRAGTGTWAKQTPESITKANVAQQSRNVMIDPPAGYDLTAANL
jgi:hypothetical protein